MRAAAAAFAVIVLLAGIVAAQPAPAATSQPNTIYVSAEGHVDAAPDTAVLRFNISAQENSAKAAYQRAARDAEQIRELLRGAGVDPAQAQFGFLAVTPVYDYRQPKRKIVAYRVNSSVTLKLKDFSKAAPIVEQLSTLDITQNQSLVYILEDTDAAKNKAVEDALRRARAEAGAVAAAGGRSLGEITYAAVDTEERVAVRQTMQFQAGLAREALQPPTEEFTPGAVTITARVNAVFALK